MSDLSKLKPDSSSYNLLFKDARDTLQSWVSIAGFAFLLYITISAGDEGIEGWYNLVNNASVFVLYGLVIGTGILAWGAYNAAIQEEKDANKLDADAMAYSMGTLGFETKTKEYRFGDNTRQNQGLGAFVLGVNHRDAIRTNTGRKKDHSRDPYAEAVAEAEAAKAREYFSNLRAREKHYAATH